MIATEELQWTIVKTMAWLEEMIELIETYGLWIVREELSCHCLVLEHPKHGRRRLLHPTCELARYGHGDFL